MVNNRKGISSLSFVIVASTVMTCTALYSTYSPNAYEVSVSGKPIAYVRSKNDVENINNDIMNYIKNRFKGVNVSGYISSTEAIAKDTAIITNELAVKNIINSIDLKVNAVQVNVEGKSVAVLADREEFNKVKDMVGKYYTDKYKIEGKKLESITSKVDFIPIQTYINQIDNIEAVAAKVLKEVIAINPENQVISRGGKATSEVMTVLSRGSISSKFGERWGRMHEGIDIAAPTGTPIYAAMSGKVIFSGWLDGYGYAIKLQHDNDIVTIYGHCSKLLVSINNKVKKGQLIGKVGSTGRSTGPHLHFEVRTGGVAVNPSKYIYK